MAGKIEELDGSEMSKSVFKRRLNFVPLPEPEPLHTNYRGPLPGTKLLLHPCYIRRPLLHRSLW